MREGTRPLVLIVEDNVPNLMLARTVLERSGYRVDEARSAEDALQSLRRERPDLILMDIQLPGQDGLSLTRQLKVNPTTAAIPIVALTAYAMEEDRKRVFAAGCDGYISKPIRVRMLTSEVEAVLERHREGQGSEGS